MKNIKIRRNRNEREDLVCIMEIRTSQAVPFRRRERRSMSGKRRRDTRRTKSVPEEAGIRWHPGFCGAAEIEFLSNKRDLEFLQEYHLSREPVRMDLLVIKRLTDVPVENEIGHLFREYNVIEYKSPDDGLTIDDYYKTIGYACLYKGLGKTVDQIPAGELTISFFREGYPRELFKKLQSMGLEVRRCYPGIYYICGKQMLFDTQVVVTGQLNPEIHCALRILSRRARINEAKTFIERAARLTEPGDRNNADAVLQVSVSANPELYRAIRRGDDKMCDALRELMKDDFEKMNLEFEKKMEAETKKMEAETKTMKAETKKAKAEIRKINGELKTAKVKAEKMKRETLLVAVKNLMETMKWTADQAMDAIKVPETERHILMAGGEIAEGKA